MRIFPHKHPHVPGTKKRLKPKTAIIAVCSVLYALYLGFLGVSTVIDNIQANNLSTDIAATKGQIDILYKNADFALYIENKAFLNGMIIPQFSVYLDDLGTKLPEGTRTQSIQISRSTIDQKETYGLALVLESIPPLREISRVIETLSGSTYFKDVSVASATTNTSSNGTTTFSYPISMTLNPTNGNTNTAATPAAPATNAQ